jgi:Cache domain
MMGTDDDAAEDLVISTWQAIELVGDARERSDAIEPTELEAVLTQAEEVLFGIISGLAKFTGRPARQLRREPSFGRALHHERYARRLWWGRRIATFHGARGFAVPKLFRKKSSKCASAGVSVLEAIAKISPRQAGIRVPDERSAGKQEFLLPRPTVETSPTNVINQADTAGEQAYRIAGDRPATGSLAAHNDERRPTKGPQRARTNLAGRLLLLVIIAVAPALAIQAWHEYDLRITREADIRQQVVQTTKQLGEQIGELREGARQMLLAVAQLASSNLHQPETCRAIFSQLKSRFPNYNLLGVADTDGQIFCASGPTSYTSIANEPFFTRAIAREGLVVGNYWADPTSGLRMIHLAEHFYDGDGHIAGVVFAGLDLTWLCDHLKQLGLPPTASALIADREGNIIARLPHSESLVGKNIRKSHEKIMDGDEAGWEEAVGVDGVTRIFGYVPAALPPRDFFLSVGQSKAEVFAGIDRATRFGIWLILAGLFAAIYVARVGSRKFIGRPFEATDASANVRDLEPAVSPREEAVNGAADVAAPRQKADEELRHPKQHSDPGFGTGRWIGIGAAARLDVAHQR